MKRKPSRLVIFLSVFIDLIGFGIVLPLLPGYAEDFGAKSFAIGAIIASFSLMQFLFAPVWGRWSDHIGRRPVMLMGNLGAAGSYVLFAYASGLHGTTGLVVDSGFARVCRDFRREHFRGLGLHRGHFAAGKTVGGNGLDRRRVWPRFHFRSGGRRFHRGVFLAKRGRAGWPPVFAPPILFWAGSSSAKAGSLVPRPRWPGPNSPNGATRSASPSLACSSAFSSSPRFVSSVLNPRSR